LAFDQFAGAGAGLGLTDMPGMPGGDKDFSLQALEQNRQKRPSNDPTTKVPSGNVAADTDLADLYLDQEED